MYSLGDTIKSLREEKKLNQEAVAKLLNVSRATISKYESGSRTPDIETLKTLAGFFDVSLDYLLGVRKSPLVSQKFSEETREYITVNKDIMDIIKDEKFIKLAKFIKNNNLDINVLETMLKNILDLKK